MMDNRIVAQLRDRARNIEGYSEHAKNWDTTPLSWVLVMYTGVIFTSRPILHDWDISNHRILWVQENIGPHYNCKGDQ